MIAFARDGDGVRDGYGRDAHGHGDGRDDDDPCVLAHDGHARHLYGPHHK